MADLLFSKGFLQPLVLQAQLGAHLLQPAVLVLHGLHLANQGRIHAPILRPPFIERRIPSHGLKTNHERAMASCNARGKAQPPAHRLRPDAGPR